MTKPIAFYEKEADKNSYLYFRKFRTETETLVSPHFHDSIELVWVTKGNCGIHINGEDFLLKEGEAAFIDRFDIHYYIHYPESEHYVLLISEAYLDNLNGFSDKRLPVFMPLGENFENIRNLLKNGDALFLKSNQTFKKGFVNVILGSLSSLFPLSPREFRGDVKALVNTLIYINENFDKNITLESLSARQGYSKTYFSALFNKFTGMNLKEYINRRRITEYERIKEKDPKLTVYAAAELCGFNGLKSFYRAYNSYGSKNRNF